MAKCKVLLDFTKLKVAEKVLHAKNSISQIEDDERFQLPDISLEEVARINDVLHQCSLNAHNGGKESTLLLHKAQREWDDAMRKLAKYVERVADGDQAMIIGAGFRVATQPIPSPRVEFSVALGEKSGTVVLRRCSVSRAKSYVWQYCVGDTPCAENEWVLGDVTSRASVELSGLQQMAVHWFRVAVVTPSGKSAFCKPLRQVVI